MELTHDYIHPIPDGGRCRIRVYAPEERNDSPVVICSDLKENGAQPVAEATSELMAEVISAHNFTAPVLWIEHYWNEAHSNEASDTFNLVHAGGFRMEETPEHSKLVGIGTPERESLSAEDVESVLGQQL